mmetsp:Transcript_130223/g.183721  ORF Transcript_130223/g.183721 Transcript_130223/m.183721 type:complete len:242 (-) Transcript_130223:26-751(-)
MAMVATLELHHHITLGEGTNQSEHSHACFSATVGEAHHLHRRDCIDDHLGQLVLQGTGSTEGSTLLHLSTQGLQHLVICMANDGRAPGANIVNILVSIHIPRIGSFDTVKNNRVATHRLESSHRAGHAAWHQILRFREDLLRLEGLEATTSTSSNLSLSAGVASRLSGRHSSCCCRSQNHGSTWSSAWLRWLGWLCCSKVAYCSALSRGDKGQSGAGTCSDSAESCNLGLHDAWLRKRESN